MTKFNLSALKLSPWLSSALAVAVLSGCASKIDTAAQQQQINEFVAKAKSAEQYMGEDEQNWWHKLGSAQLNQLVSNALANNYDLQTSQLVLKSALARIGEQQAQYLPQGGVEVGAKRSGLGDTNSHNQVRM